MNEDVKSDRVKREKFNHPAPMHSRTRKSRVYDHTCTRARCKAGLSNSETCALLLAEASTAHDEKAASMAAAKASKVKANKEKKVQLAAAEASKVCPSKEKKAHKSDAKSSKRRLDCHLVVQNANQTSKKLCKLDISSSHQVIYTLADEHRLDNILIVTGHSNIGCKTLD